MEVEEILLECESRMEETISAIEKNLLTLELVEPILIY